MSGRGGLATFFVFLFLSVIILLQVLSIVQSDRLYERLNHLNQTLERAGHVGAPDDCVTSDDRHPGDDGDWLIWAFRVEPKTLNPISAETDIYTVWITIPNIFEPLLVHDFDAADGRQLKPHLAESYEVSSDGLEITFRLRDDIHFSDGTPLTADDVIFTYQTITNPKVDAANVANRYADVLKVTKIDNLVVKFYLKRPHFLSLENLSFARTGILPKHVYQFADPDRFNKRVSNPVGSGPYVFDRWDMGRQVVLRRNENYWGRKPKLQRIIYQFIANPVASVQALRSHQVDIVIPEPEQFAELANNSRFSKEFYCLSYWTPATPFYYIGWNQGTPFFSDKLVRRAMTGIIDRQEIIAHLLQGRGRQITGPFYFLGPDSDPRLALPLGAGAPPAQAPGLIIAYDPQTSGQLLDKAGWRDTDGDGLRDKDGVPLRFKFMYSNSYALFERLAKLLKDEAAKVGVEVIAEPCEWSILWDRLNRREFQAYVAGWAGDAVEDPYRLFHSSQIGNGGSNFVGFHNPGADVIIEQARRTINDAERHKLHQRLHGILHEEQPYTFLFTRPTFRLVDRRFKNVVVHKLGLNYLQWYVPRSEQRYE